MAQSLTGKRIAILATDGFEESELTVPRGALTDAGAEVVVVSPKPGQIQGMRHRDRGNQVSVSAVLEEAEASEDSFAALVLPGGVANPDELRTDPGAVSFVKSFFDHGKPVGAICHGPWLLVEADVARGRHVTSWPSLQTDLRNAGANWVDEEVVVDGNLVTSRKPDDLPAFCDRLISLIAEASDERVAAPSQN